jgi:S1-C subfamily serine protease
VIMLGLGLVFGIGVIIGGKRVQPAAVIEPSTQVKKEDKAAADEQRRKSIASFAAIFQSDEKIAAELLKEFEAVRESHRSIIRDDDPGNDPKDVTFYYTQHLAERAEANPILKRWLGSKPASFIGENLWSDDAVRRRVKGALPDFLLAGKYSSSGTGFFISPDGWLVTNAHVVKHRTEVDVRGADGTIIKARVAKTDGTTDLALIKTDSPPEASLIIRSDTLPLGTRVFTIGFPNADTQGVKAKFTEGSISSLAGWRDDPHDYQISVPLQQGNSGGALVDTNTGLVAGVVTSSLAPSVADNVSYAIKASLLVNLLRSVPDAASAPSSSPSGELADRMTNIDRASKATVLVLVK